MAGVASLNSRQFNQALNDTLINPPTQATYVYRGTPYEKSLGTTRNIGCRAIYRGISYKISDRVSQPQPVGVRIYRGIAY